MLMCCLPVPAGSGREKKKSFLIKNTFARKDVDSMAMIILQQHQLYGHEIVVQFCENGVTMPLMGKSAKVKNEGKYQGNDEDSGFHFVLFMVLWPLGELAIDDLYMCN